MPDDDEPGSAGAVQSLLAELRSVAERLSGVLGLPASLPPTAALNVLSALPAIPPAPGALSAAQLQAIARMLEAQRASIAAMGSQLSAFDEQLEVFERLLGPLVEWSTTWADLEKRLTDLRPGKSG